MLVLWEGWTPGYTGDGITGYIRCQYWSKQEGRMLGWRGDGEMGVGVRGGSGEGNWISTRTGVGQGQDFLTDTGAGVCVTPPCVAESHQRHAQHPLKMLGIDFSCGSYQRNSERIMLLNSLYQTDMSLYSNRYLFVRSKIGGQKWQPHILCKTMSFFASRLTPWFAWQPRAPAQKTTCAEMQIVTYCYPSTVATGSLTTCAVAMKNALFRVIKIFEFGKWVEHHNGDHVIHVTSDDITGDRKVAQPSPWSRVHATNSVALATRWCPPGWVKA